MERPDGDSGPASEPPSRSVSRESADPTPVSGAVEWLLVVALLAAPMAVVPGGDDAPTLVSLWGFVTLGGDGSGLGGYPVWAYFLDQPRPFATLPPSIRAWPLALGFHLLATGSATSGVALGREDRRVTGGVLVLGAAATLWVAAGLGVRFGVGTTAGWLTVLPVSALATLAVAVAAYGGDLRRIVTH
ncbi:TIGR04206 family protein [Halorubrum trapanicum]|uniref:TIGR04206 family protein n=1 Tax=Halorubrum trapanicum TaxID=29284 RepID=UPI000BBAE869|nr:TIGR04206 family protein [Halorubrum trapanicum]